MSHRRRWSARIARRVLVTALAAGVGGCIVVANDDYGSTDGDTAAGDGMDGAGDAGSDDDGITGVTDLPGPAPLTCGYNETVADAGCPEDCDWCDGETCVLRCGGKQVCDKAKLRCPQGHPCRVECDGEQSCKEADIECPKDYACQASCSGKQTCEKLKMKCSTGTCELTCGYGVETCKDLDFECGANDSALICATIEPSAEVEPPKDGTGCSCSAGLLCSPGNGGENDDDD